MHPPNDENVALTEPVIVPCLFLTGVGVERNDDVIRMVGWVQMPDFGGDMIERRITVRIALPEGVARQLASDIREMLGRGDH